MKIILIFTAIVLVSGCMTTEQRRNFGKNPQPPKDSNIVLANYNPCTDKLYIELQKNNLDSLSEREYQYYLEKTKQCNDYMKLGKQLQTKKEIESKPGNASTIIAIVFGGLIVLGLISLAASTNK